MAKHRLSCFLNTSVVCSTLLRTVITDCLVSGVAMLLCHNCSALTDVLPSVLPGVLSGVLPSVLPSELPSELHAVHATGWSSCMNTCRYEQCLQAGVCSVTLLVLGATAGHMLSCRQSSAPSQPVQQPLRFAALLGM